MSTLVAVSLLSSTFMMMPSAYSQSIVFQDDYSTNSGWTQVGTLVTVDDPSFPGIVKFNGVPDASDRRVHKSLGTTLSDTEWVLESEFIATAFNIPSHGVFTLTSGTGDPIITAPSMLGIYYTNTGDAGIGFRVVTSDATFLDGVSHGSKILVDQNQQVYLRLSRTSATTATFEVFSDAARTQHVTGSPVQITTIPANISGLDTLQHANASHGGALRNLTAEIDNTVIFSTPPEPEPIIQQILSQIQDILASILGLDTRVTELEDRVSQLEEKIDILLPPDSDNDGIPDSSDDCPTEPETINGFEDTDGCPDTPPPTSDPTTPVLDSAELISGVYHLVWTQPPTSLGIPDGGYDIVIDGDDTDEEHRTTSLQTQIGGLDTSVTHCFEIQARWTQVGELEDGNEICVPPLG